MVGILAAAVIVSLVAFGTLVVRVGDPGGAAGPAPAGLRSDAVAVRPLAGDPLRLRIPAIGVDAALVQLGLNGDGTLEVPAYEDAGWYSGASRPGAVGPAVIAAHLDSLTGPAVFYRLKNLKRGDVIHVDYPNETVSFAVKETRIYAKT